MSTNLPFDCVILSTNLDPDYWQFFPSVARAWQALFKVPVHLAVVGSDSRHREFTGAFGGVGHSTVAWLSPVSEALESTQAKLARYYLGASFSAQTRVLLHDIDYLPLSAELTLRRIGKLPDLPDVIVSGGCGRAPILTTSGTLARMFSPTHQGWGSFVYALVDATRGSLKTIDVTNKLESCTDSFSSEMLLNYLALKQRVACSAHNTFNLAIHRDNWSVEPAILAAGQYAGAYLPRPLLKHYTKVHPLLEHLDCITAAPK